MKITDSLRFGAMTMCKFVAYRHKKYDSTLRFFAYRHEDMTMCKFGFLKIFDPICISS